MLFCLLRKGVFKLGKRIHRNDEINRRFLQVDKILLENPKYEKLSEGAILAYSILRDRLDLSKANSDVYTDSEGFLYVIYTDEELGYILHRTRQTANARKKELEKFGLLEMVRGGYQEPNRIYICEPDTCSPDEYLSNQYKEKLEQKVKKMESKIVERHKEKYLIVDVTNREEITCEDVETLVAQQKSKILTTRSQNSGQLEVKNFDTINTEYKDTENIKTKEKKYDDDKRTSSPSGKEASITSNDKTINLIISNLREATKEDMTNRSFNSVVRKVVDKYNQGKVNSFRDYLVTALVRKIEELELRRIKDKAKHDLVIAKKQKAAEKLQNRKINKNVVFYNWLEK